MKDKLLKTQYGQFVIASFTGQNESGLVPYGDRVVVMVDVAAPKTGGNIEIPETIVERQTMASETGVLVAVGEGAFAWTPDRSRPWTGAKPKVGDRVFIEKYSGSGFPGRDGKLYRAMDDRCVFGVLQQKPTIVRAVSGDESKLRA